MNKKLPLSTKITNIAFWGIHLVPFGIFWTGFTLRSVVLCFALYWIRMFLITGGYHRYFSHRSFKTSRWFQFVLAFLGTTCVQKGVLWWASGHRRHHKYSDTLKDVHSPRMYGAYEAHFGWVASGQNSGTDLSTVRDLSSYPELRWLERYHFVAPILLTFLCYYSAGWSGVVVGMGWSTVLFWHATFSINSLAHLWGKQRFMTGDDSRNNLLLALLTMGDGWHNNHHHYQSSVRQGFYWWEVDATYYILVIFQKLGLIWDLRLPTKKSLVTFPHETHHPLTPQ